MEQDIGFQAKPKKFNRLLFVAVPLAIILLAAGGYYWYRNSTVEQTPVEQSSDNASQSSTSETASSLSNDESGTYGWSYVGDFPVSAVNITTVKIPDGRYAAYYVGGQPGVDNYKKPGRAFSIDGITWTVDESWKCADLCEEGGVNTPTLPHRKPAVQ